MRDSFAFAQFPYVPQHDGCPTPPPEVTERVGFPPPSLRARQPSIASLCAERPIADIFMCMTLLAGFRFRARRAAPVETWTRARRLGAPLLVLLLAATRAHAQSEGPLPGMPPLLDPQ